MPTRFDRWMRSKLSAITSRTPSRFGPLAAQSRLDPLPYSLPASTASGVPSDRYRSAASYTLVTSPLGRWVVKSPRCPGRSRCAGGCSRTCPASSLRGSRRGRRVEVDGLHAPVPQVGAGGRIELDRTRGRDVVGRDRITDLHEHRAPSTSPTGGPRRARRRTAVPARRSSRDPTRRRDRSAWAGPASARRRPRCARTGS